ncbi:hypothetical protein PSEUDO8Z_150117 [Pseudomonas sp. 8Z]|nr:hypothetical protein PSEUDO8Z_150117 [Pseudomonas sp. 8Z]
MKARVENPARAEANCHQQRHTTGKPLPLGANKNHKTLNLNDFNLLQTDGTKIALASSSPHHCARGSDKCSPPAAPTPSISMQPNCSA